MAAPRVVSPAHADDEAAPAELWDGLRREAPVIAGLITSATVFYVAPWAPVYGVALLVVALLSIVRLERALILVPLFVPYFMSPKHLGTKELAPSEVFLVLDLLTVAMYLLLPQWRGRLVWNQLLRSPFLRPAVLFLIAGTLSTALATDHHEALRAYREWILEPVAFGALLLLLADRPPAWYWLFGALTAAGLCVAVIGLWQFATHQGLSSVPGTSFKRVEALYGSPDNLGLFYDRVVCIWFAVVVLWRLPTAARLLGIALAPLYVSTLFLTYSRGAWLAIVSGCLLTVAVGYRWGRWIALACLVLGVLALGVKGPSLARALRAGHQHTVQQRLDIWRSSVHMLRDHPVAGVGPDNFLHYYAPTRKENLWQRECAAGLGYIQPGAGAEPCLSHPHNELLDFWLSAGVLGITSFLWLQYVFWQCATAVWRRTRGTPNGALLVGVMAAMAAGLIHGLVDNSYFVMDLAIAFWLLCGYVSYLASAKAPEPA